MPMALFRSSCPRKDPLARVLQRRRVGRLRRKGSGSALSQRVGHKRTSLLEGAWSVLFIGADP